MRVLALVLAGVLLCSAAAGAWTIVGTDGPDRLLGTPRADTLSAKAGNDVLAGARGNDLLVAGAGRDRVDGGPGADLVSVEYDGSRDTAVCGPGLDTVTADPLDRVAVDCELVGRRLSRDPYTNPDSQHETEVEPDSFTFGRTTVAVFQVGRRRGGGASNIGYAVSADDGQTWRSGLLPGLTALGDPPGPSARASDPVVAYDAAHGVWLASTLALAAGTTRLAVNRSTDGLTWESALAAAEERVAEGIAFDKNWIACDNGASSPFFGRCYLAYTHSTNRDTLEVISTDDAGLTWSAPTQVGVRPAVGAFPVVRPTGELVLVYLWETRPLAIAASRSTDGGASFEGAVRIADLAPGGQCGIPGFRMPPLPSVDSDASGRIWTTWQDCPAGRTQAAVLVSSSPDGREWSAPARVTSGSDAVLPAIGIDPESGRVALAYHRRLASGLVVELVESRVARAGWSAPRRLSAQPMRLEWMPRTTSGRMLGDYISVHYAASRPLVVWALASPPAGGELRQAIYATRG
jgi:hypothetical protein